MSRYTGPQYKGASRAAKQIRNEEAVERNSRTTDERRGVNRPHSKPVE